MADDTGNKSLYVGNLSSTCTEAVLFEKFSPIGAIASIRICRDMAGSSLGYAYVNFSKAEDAKTALDTLNHDSLDGQCLRIMFAQKDFKSKLLRAANLVVKNLPKDIDDKLLRDMFTSYGSVLSVKVMTYPNGMSKGYGFVQFENEASALEATSALDGAILQGRKITVVKFIPVEERQKFQELAYSNNVFVKNLGPSITDEEFEKLCDCFGVILSSKVVTNEANESKGYGFVSFKNAESANRAVEQLNRLCLNGKRLFATVAKAKSPSRKIL